MVDETECTVDHPEGPVVDAGTSTNVYGSGATRVELTPSCWVPVNSRLNVTKHGVLDLEPAASVMFLLDGTPSCASN